MKQIWLQMLKEGRGQNWYQIGFIYWEAKKTYKKEKNREWFIGANIRVAFGYFFESTVAKVYGAISVRHS